MGGGNVRFCRKELPCECQRGSAKKACKKMAKESAGGGKGQEDKVWMSMIVPKDFVGPAGYGLDNPTGKIMCRDGNIPQKSVQEEFPVLEKLGLKPAKGNCVTRGWTHKLKANANDGKEGAFYWKAEESAGGRKGQEDKVWMSMIVPKDFVGPAGYGLDNPTGKIM